MSAINMKKAAGVLAAVAVVPVFAGGFAHAETPGTVYFSASIFNCSINDAGDVGCDASYPRSMFIDVNAGSGDASIPVPFPVSQVVIDVPWAPAHPGFAPGAHTLPGGNPNISVVGHPSGSGATSGSEVTHAGASCSTGFHGSFSCTSKGHNFSYYESIMAN
ncbi:hypothetical protein [Antrihabitans cavernicola]|uniref:Uncharacterized protein n=1 Tax=Antrihabitans cavernicola TaxID=2495913 RepID=A0A5A7SAQ5_9NOCA|nr:hypothetical protein [Spelaeibacter cavernicola]KAA0021605.1 hypothetical protein FOY51_17045 [Spelaeibacter cavernicola]